MHPGIIVIDETLLVEGGSVDKPEQLDGLGTHVGIGTLVGELGPIAACQIRATERFSEADALVGIVHGRVVAEGDIELEEPFGQRKTLLGGDGLDQTVAAGSDLPFALGHIAGDWRMALSIC